MPVLAAVVALIVPLLGAVGVAAEPVKVRFAETVTQGWIEVTDLGGKVLGHGELTQWFEQRAVANRLVIRFDDGSLYDERLRFSQTGVFRLLAYHLLQRGPSFATSSEVKFERPDRYDVRQRAGPDGEEETASGTTEIPDDVSNGMVSTLLRNLPAGASATTHLLAFTPEPRVLELHLSPAGTDAFSVGSIAGKATRFLVKPKVPGVTGVLASLTGKQPPSVNFWLTQGRAPVFVRFQGPLYVDGPTWRMQQAVPGWPR